MEKDNSATSRHDPFDCAQGKPYAIRPSPFRLFFQLAQVFDHLVRVKDVGPYLAAPGDIVLAVVDLLQPFVLLALFCLVKACLEHLHGHVLVAVLGFFLLALNHDPRGKVGESYGAARLVDMLSPGTGCPVIAAVTGTDAVLLVIEPSLSSFHDAERVIELVHGFRIPIYAVLNKADINNEVSDSIEQYLETRGIPLLGRIPFDPDFVSAMVHGQAITTFAPHSGSSRILGEIWEHLL